VLDKGIMPAPGDVNKNDKKTYTTLRIVGITVLPLQSTTKMEIGKTANGIMRPFAAHK